jgi:hypothetical protein
MQQNMTGRMRGGRKDQLISPLLNAMTFVGTSLLRVIDAFWRGVDSLSRPTSQKVIAGNNFRAVAPSKVGNFATKKCGN